MSYLEELGETKADPAWRIQCDEQRPQCACCLAVGGECQYPVPSISKQHNRSSGKPKSSTLDAAESILETTPSPGTTLEVSQVLHALSEPVTLRHLELLHHFSTATYKTFTPVPSQQDVWQVDAVRLAFGSPWLMSEILAIAAIHLAHCRPDAQQYYTTLAMSLQNAALAEFRSIKLSVGMQAPDALFFFTSLLAVHFSAENLSHHDSPSGQVIERFLQCLSMLRSVRRLMSDTWMDSIAPRKYPAIFDIERLQKPYDIPEECRQLCALADSRVIDDASRGSYVNAIEKLSWLFAISKVPHVQHNTLRWIFAWALEMDDTFCDLLMERRPEALVILGYYAVLLHYYRDAWAVGAAGSVLLNAIVDHTGSRWQTWLRWPKEMTNQSL